MARQVVCKICRKKGDSDNFYKVTGDNGLNKYYCSKEEYENLMNERSKFKSLMEYVALEVLEYEDGQIVPPTMVKKINKLNEFYDYDVISECFKQNKESIQYWVKVKNFSSEYGMTSYIMKIIEGSINDIYKTWKYKKQQQIKIENNSVDFDILNQLDNHNAENKEDNGILDFLDEEDI
ncbi:hypothetical protein AB0Y20_00835 [Heyndrickxia oleronia]|uniref:hypothetical protein n=1 Tax=Heyndrickxia oleronia TaxID=38875 RepID=UPI003F27CC11